MPFFVPGGGYLELTEINRVAGSDSGDNNTGDNVFFAMSGAGDNNVGTRIIGIGVLAGAENTSDDLIAIGENAGGGAGNGLLTNSNIAIGNDAMQTAEDAARNIVIGHRAASSIINQANQNFDDNVVIGHLAVGNMGLATFSLDASVYIGSSAGRDLNPTGGGNSGNVAIGGSAGRGAAAGTVSANNCVFIGREAGENHTTISGVVCVGRRSGRLLTTGDDNVFIGAQAGSMLTTGERNVLVGSNAAFAYNGSESDCTIVGSETGSTRRGSRDTFLGAQITAGPSGVGAGGNIIIGARANDSPSNQNLSNNILMEVFDGVDRSTIMFGEHDDTQASVMFGHNNALAVIGTARDIVALVADGAENIVKLVDGNPAAATNPVAGGYLYSIAGALHWVGSAGTDSVVAIA